jgi:hypothetical protein
MMDCYSRLEIGGWPCMARHCNIFPCPPRFAPSFLEPVFFDANLAMADVLADHSA